MLRLGRAGCCLLNRLVSSPHTVKEVIKLPIEKVNYGQVEYLLVAQRVKSTRAIFEAGFRKTDKQDQRTSPLGWFLLLIPITTFGLGCWQVKRKFWKEELIKKLEQQTQMPPAPLPDNLEDLNKMEYRTVQVRGHFLHDKELILGPRSFIRADGEESAGGLFSQQNAGTGYLIITPFQLSDRNDIILINRGWVPRKQKKPETRAQGQITEEVELCGVVRLAETRPQFSPDQKGDIFLYRDLPKMCALTGASPVLLDADYASSVPGGPIGGQTRVTLRNEHMSYIITWYSLSAATAFMWYRQIIKRVPF